MAAFDKILVKHESTNRYATCGRWFFYGYLKSPLSEYCQHAFFIDIESLFLMDDSPEMDTWLMHSFYRQDQIPPEETISKYGGKISKIETKTVPGFGYAFLCWVLKYLQSYDFPKLGYSRPLVHGESIINIDAFHPLDRDLGKLRNYYKKIGFHDASASRAKPAIIAGLWMESKVETILANCVNLDVKDVYEYDYQIKPSIRYPESSTPMTWNAWSDYYIANFGCLPYRLSNALYAVLPSSVFLVPIGPDTISLLKEGVDYAGAAIRTTDINGDIDKIIRPLKLAAEGGDTFIYFQDTGKSGRKVHMTKDIENSGYIFSDTPNKHFYILFKVHIPGISDRE